MSASPIHVAIHDENKPNFAEGSRRRAEYDQTMAELHAMYTQEDAYSCADYLQDYPTTFTSCSLERYYPRQPQYARGRHSPRSVRCISPQSIRTQTVVFFTAKDRAALVHYSYRVCKFCSHPTEVAAMAVNYFDRFLTTEASHQWLENVPHHHKRTFMTLTFLTCLYMAMKVHSPDPLSSYTVAALSRGNHRSGNMQVITPQQVEYMERVILYALNWRLNPPTAGAFARHFLDLVRGQGHVDDTQHLAANDLVRMQLEMAMTDYAFVTTRPSILAYVALRIALNSMSSMNSITSPMQESSAATSILEFIRRQTLPAKPDNGDNSGLQEIENRMCVGIARDYFHLGEENCIYQDEDYYDNNMDDSNHDYLHHNHNDKLPRNYHSPIDGTLWHNDQKMPLSQSAVMTLLQNQQGPFFAVPP